VGAVIFNLS